MKGEKSLQVKVVKRYLIGSRRGTDLKDFNRQEENRRAFWEEIKVQKRKVYAERTGFPHAKE